MVIIRKVRNNRVWRRWCRTVSIRWLIIIPTTSAAASSAARRRVNVTRRSTRRWWRVIVTPTTAAAAAAAGGRRRRASAAGGRRRRWRRWWRRRRRWGGVDRSYRTWLASVAHFTGDFVVGDGVEVGGGGGEVEREKECGEERESVAEKRCFPASLHD